MGAQTEGFGRRGSSAAQVAEARRYYAAARPVSDADVVIAELKKLLFKFDGRIARLPYWTCKIAVIFALWLMTLPAASLYRHSKVAAAAHDTSLQLWLLLMGLAVVLLALYMFFWISFAVQIKRWHDRGRSWPWLLVGFIPVIGWIWQEYECGFCEGGIGANRFGPSPKALAIVAYENLSSLLQVRA
jgi:uncharacterized membrane protein YhaH (DUF805 family)